MPNEFASPLNYQHNWFSTILKWMSLTRYSKQARSFLPLVTMLYVLHLVEEEPKDLVVEMGWLLSLLPHQTVGCCLPQYRGI